MTPAGTVPLWLNEIGCRFSILCYPYRRMTLSLQVAERTGETRAQLQADDLIPAVVYGPKQAAVSLRMSRGDFERAFKEGGESTIIELQGLAEPTEVLIHAVEFHPTKGGIMHVDFYAFERGKDMTTEVPVTLTGQAPIEKTGGMVNQVLHEVTITCRPSALPKEIEVSIDGLTEADMQILISDLPKLDGVVIEHEADEVVAVAAGERDETEDEATDEVDMDAIQVEEKGKAAEEDAENEG